MNKYERNIDQKFDLGNFNKVFEEKRNKNDYSIVNVYDDDVIETIPIHKRTIEYIIIRTRELFYTCLKMLSNKKNPLPFVMQNEERKFSFSLFLIVMGILLLLFSSLMISNKQNL
jgi:hypothetical protein